MIHNVAHRGASAYEPENTLRAFERAIEMGATMLELDLHLSRDGHLIVIHDADLSRTTNGKGQVTDMSLEEIKRYDAGLGEQVPTLPEVIELARGRARLYIELKGQQTPEPLVHVLRASHFTDQVIVGSFYPWLPQKVKWLAPEIRTSLLVGEWGRDEMVEWALAVGADYVHPCWERLDPQPHRLLTPTLLERIRSHHLGIVIWHEERPEELSELVKHDVDAICTNTPDILAEILKRKEGYGLSI
ncbi:MAG: glycerophosphodiester phosphodiesterase family protein [Anaerolineae bacterium]